MQLNKLIFPALLAILAMIGLMPALASACTNSTGAWVNCTVAINQSHPMASLFADDQANGPWFFWLWYVSIYIGIVIITRIAHQEGTASFAYAAFSGVLLAILFKSYGWIGGTAMGVSLAVLVITMLVLYLFRQ